jgi:hypothetical protein
LEIIGSEESSMARAAAWMKEQSMMNQPKQSPSTGESTKPESQHAQEPARSDVNERPDVSRSGADAEAQRQHGAKGPKSGGMGPKQ